MKINELFFLLSVVYGHSTIVDICITITVQFIVKVVVQLQLFQCSASGFDEDPALYNSKPTNMRNKCTKQIFRK